MDNLNKQYTFSELIEIFPEAKSYIKNKLKEQITQAKADLQQAKILKEEFDYKIIRIVRLQDKWFWEMVRDIIYLEPLTEGRVKRIKENIFRLSRLKPQKQEAKKDGKITDIDIGQAKQVPLTNFITINRSGFAKCPFHPDKTPSFKYYPKDNTWHCFSCGTSKDTIDFIMKKEGLTFIEAVKYLVNK